MKFHIEEDTLTIQLEGLERFWAIKRQLVISKANIAKLDWQETLLVPRRLLGLRVGGSAIPGGLFAGRFWGKEGKNFLYVQRTRGLFGDIRMQHVLSVELVDYEYQRLFLTVDDPDIASQIVAWWAGNS